jgi:biotin operon repressor
MSTKVIKREAGMDARRGLLRELRLLIRCRPHTSHTLAQKLGVSTATVDRAVKELRSELEGEGMSLVSVREGREWHYEIRMRDDVWENDPLLRAVGSVKGIGRLGKESVKDALYGKARRGR